MQRIKDWACETVASDQFEGLIAVFPICVVVLAAVTFVLGGRCATWQWYVALVLAVGISARKGWNGRMCSAVILYLLYLLTVWVVCRINWISSWNDYSEYQMPAVRMLIEGWNPLRETTAESISAALSIDPVTFRPWHVISMCKSAWYYNAVAYFFVREPYNIMSPVYFAVLPAVVLQIVKALKGVSIVVRMSLVLLMILLCHGPFAAIDAVVALAGIGLLFSFREILDNGRWRWEMLVAFSFWLLTVKQIAGICCVVFWLGFAVSMFCVKRRFFRNSLLIIMIASALAVIVDLSPYYASWRTYGHPLYPCYSIDEKKHPVVDIVGDFLQRNEDAAIMSHLGATVNAYVSPDLAKAYYAWKLDKPGFAPHADIWEWHHGKGCTAPTDLKFRIMFCVSLCLCLLLGDRWTRVLSIVVTVGVLSVPTPMIGYVRYVPWWVVLPVLAVFSVSQVKMSFRMSCALACCLGGFSFFHMAFYQAFIWERSYLNRKYLRCNAPREIFAYYKPCVLGAKIDGGSNGCGYRLSKCNVDLLKRQTSDLKNSEVKELIPIGMSEAELSLYPTLVYDSLLRLPKGEDAWSDSEYRDILNESSRIKRILRYPVFFLKSWTCTVGRLICMRCCPVDL